MTNAAAKSGVKSAFALSICLLIAKTGAWAGPPFVTDDPEPVDLHHWEVYAATQRIGTTSDISGTLPHLEINNGIAPNLQVHLIAPYSFDRSTGGATVRGYGDTELGAKYRFVQETQSKPMVGIFPLVEVPTGNSARGLGGGHFQFFLPVWLQKSWGPWTTYGGGGYWINPGSGNQNFWLTGLVVQRDLSSSLTLGGEIFHTGPAAVGEGGRLNFNLGGQYNIDEERHILFSVGSGISGDITSMGYLAYQWTLGPRELSKQEASSKL